MTETSILVLLVAPSQFWLSRSLFFLFISFYSFSLLSFSHCFFFSGEGGVPRRAGGEGGPPSPLAAPQLWPRCSGMSRCGTSPALIKQRRGVSLHDPRPGRYLGLNWVKSATVRRRNVALSILYDFDLMGFRSSGLTSNVRRTEILLAVQLPSSSLRANMFGRFCL